MEKQGEVLTAEPARSRTPSDQMEPKTSRTPSDQVDSKPPFQSEYDEPPSDNRTFKRKAWDLFKEPGSALQIVTAAALAIAIGFAVTTTVDDIPEEAPIILAIPGQLWLRALQAVVLPLIVCAMILAIQNLRGLTGGGAKLARVAILYYILTTLLAIVISIILTSQVWARMFTVASEESLARPDADSKDGQLYADREERKIPDVVVDIFNSFIPNNIVGAFATNSQLLACLITSVIVGYLIDPKNSAILKGITELERMIMTAITFLIKLAPLGVFFLILPNMFKLDIDDVGSNLGFLIAGGISNMMIHLFVVLPLLFFGFTRKNPYAYWIKCSPAWTTAWGSASSAATLPVTMRMARARGVPESVVKFALPLGCLINMDGTAIYFPLCVVFLAVTQGIALSPADYVIICLLATLTSIATTPIPSASLVLTVMIAQSVNVPLSGMYGVIIAVDWLLDRFRTMTNVSGDLFAAAIFTKLTGMTDHDEEELREEREGEIRTERVGRPDQVV